MSTRSSRSGHVEQIAYAVPALDAAMVDHSRIFGSGPYFVRETHTDCVYRGSPARLGYRFALGQWGSVQIELVEPVGATPSIFSELGASDAPPMVLHHVCLLPDDLQAQVTAFEDEGHPAVLDFMTPLGSRVVMMDTVGRCGHFVELHERTRDVEHVYAKVREAGKGFHGDRLIRPFEELF